jgi:hypothetical protein
VHLLLQNNDSVQRSPKPMTELATFGVQIDIHLGDGWNLKLQEVAEEYDADSTK